MTRQSLAGVTVGLFVSLLLGAGVVILRYGRGPQPPQASSPQPAAQRRTIEASVTTQPAPPGPTVVQFVSPKRGWAAGPGAIWSTDSGGSTWQRVYSGSAGLTAVHFANTSDGWAWGLQTLLATTDGGTTWQARSVPASPMRSVDFVTATSGWMVAGGAANTTDFSIRDTSLYHTMNGGITWHAVASPPDVLSVCFGNGRLGWLAGGPHIWQTTDGGASWSLVFTAPVQDPPSWSPAVACAGTAAWVTFRGDEASMGHVPYVIYRSIDDGPWTAVMEQDYSSQLYPKVKALNGPPETGMIDVLSPTVAFLSQTFFGTGVVTRTTDGGQSWDRKGVIVTDANRTISFVDANHGWLAGNGVIPATTDGGRTWREQYPSAAPRPAGTIAFVGPDLGYGLGTVGDPDAVLRTEDGGTTWRIIAELPDGPLLSPRGAAFQALSFVSREHGWAASSGGGLWVTTDGGLHWVRQPVAGLPVTPGNGVAQIVFADARHGCLLTDTLGAWVTTNGGRTWSPGPGYVDSALDCAARLVDPAWAHVSGLVALTGPRSGWRSNGSSISYTDDAGATWTRYLWPKGHFLGGPSYSFANREDGWILTDNGIVRTRDGGTTWNGVP